MKRNLQHPFLMVQKGGIVSYGGNQSWFDQSYMKKSGCGVICSTNLLVYLGMYRKGCRTEYFQGLDDGIHSIIMERDYRCLAGQLHRKYFPVLPLFGMPGWFIVGGLNRYFRKYKIRLKAFWGIRKGNLWKRMQKMLDRDIPVILAVGPNFPFPWKNNRLSFYIKKTDGDYERACSVKAHFITVTYMDGIWLRISSWGKEYYIRRKEYMDYVKQYSSFLVSNLIYIKEF